MRTLEIEGGESEMSLSIAVTACAMDLAAAKVRQRAVDPRWSESCR